MFAGRGMRTPFCSVMYNIDFDFWIPTAACLSMEEWLETYFCYHNINTQYILFGHVTS